MRQRRTGDPTVTRKPGPNGTALQQENTALRQKLTALEQELAQQRAMAQPGQQAADLPYGKIVKARAALPEYYSALRLPALRPRPWAPDPAPPLPVFEDWVPQEARQAIEEWWKLPFLDENVREMLERLATDDRMDTGVWQNRHVKGVTKFIISYAVLAFAIPPTRRPKPVSTKRADRQRVDWQKYEQHWVQYRHPPRPDLLSWAGLVVDLKYVLASYVFGPTIDEAWSRHWRGDPAMNTRGAAISFLDALFRCFVSMDEEYQSNLADMGLPTIFRWNDQTPQRSFSQFMSNKMKKHCGHYCDAVVAALTAVAFDLDDLDSNDVRRWRRLQAAK
jgi:hypothetical protein